VKVLIVGNGVAGVTAAQAIVRADPDARVHIFGAEPYPYYHRPRLWEFIAGQIDQSDLYFRPPAWYAERGIQLDLEKQVTALDPLAHHVTLADGARVGYDRLLLATGGRSFVPPFDGVGKKGVFTLRTLEDALAIKEYAQNVSSAVVIGGGLLGLETARALLSLDLEVSVIEFVPHLLPRQLDREGARVLQSRLEAMGLRILIGAATEAILGDERATGVRLKSDPEPSVPGPTDREHGRQDGRVIDGELVLISTGIRSRVELAQEAGLEVNRGVVVDAHLCTSAADVYAAGDVAEFEGIVYGIIPAAIEQARIAAANMVAGSSTTSRQDSGRGGTAYDGTVPATTLKIVGIDLTCLGEATAGGDEFVVLRKVDPATGTYRRLALRDDKIVGAILLGDTQNAQSLKKLIATRRDVSAWSDRLLDESFDLKALLVD
jgi:nitrite reductase (NADH) large subunit